MRDSKLETQNSKLKTTMIIDLTFPAMSPTMTEGTLVAWKVKAGDTVKKNQVIAEVQTDKAVAEWESPEAGTIAALLLEAGKPALVNMVGAILTTKGEDFAAAVTKGKALNDKLKSASAPAAPAPAPEVPAQHLVSGPMPSPVVNVSRPAANRSYRITPVAAKIAAANGLDLSKVAGSGPSGRITKADVEKAQAAGTAKIGAGAAKAEKPKLKVLRADAAGATVPLSPMRTVIAQRLTQSKQQIPHFYVSQRIDAGALAALREQLNLLDGVKVTVNDLIIRACALALRAHPKVNATFDGKTITRYDSADISIGVALPDGLITPIVFKAHTLSVRQIGDAVRVLAQKAKDGKLQPSEFQGGSFTISNLGMYGVENFQAIVNPPQVAILAVAGMIDEPVVRGDQVVPGKILRVTLSADHRAVDGADAAEFLGTLKTLLENPAALLA